MTTATKHEAMGYITKGVLYSNLAVDGITSLNMILLPNNQYETPVSTDAITINDTTNVVIVDPGVSLAVLSIVMPGRPNDGKIVQIVVMQDITSMFHTASGSDTLINPFPLAITAGATGTWYYRLTNSTWYSMINPEAPIGPADGDITGATTLTAGQSGHYYITSADVSYSVQLPEADQKWHFSFTMIATANTNAVSITYNFTPSNLHGTIVMPTFLAFADESVVTFGGSANVGSTLLFETTGGGGRVRVTGASSVDGFTLIGVP